MSAKDTGGSAFPVIGAHRRAPEDSPGMTLRDYFAAKAMQGMLANPFYAQQIDNSETSGDIGKAAYYHADALLQVRGQS